MPDNFVNKIVTYSWIFLVLLLVFCRAAGAFFIRNPLPWSADRVTSMIGLMGAVVFSAALPILIRILSYQASVKKGGMSFIRFQRMKRLSLISVGIGVVFALFSYLLPIFRYHLYLAILAAIYGVYSVLPFKENLLKDLKGFGVSYEK